MDKNLTDNGRRVYIKALKFFKDKKSDRAEKVLNKFIKNNPDEIHGLHYLLLGNILINKKKDSEALKVFLKSAKKFKNYRDVWKKSAFTAYQLQKYQSVLSSLSEMDKLKSLSKKELKLKLAALYKLKKWEKASYTAQKLYKDMDEKDVRGYLYALYKSKSHLRLYKVIEDQLEKTGNPDWWKVLARYAFKSGETEVALSAMKTYASLKEMDKKERELMSALLFKAKIYDEALEYVLKDLDERLDCKKIIMAGHIYQKLDKKDEALNILEKGINSGCGRRIYRCLGMLYYRNRQYLKSAEIFSKGYWNSKYSKDKNYYAYMTGVSFMRQKDNDKTAVWIKKIGKKSVYKKSAEEILNYLKLQ